MNHKYKKQHLAIVGILLVVVIGATFAHFSQELTTRNHLEEGKYKTELTDFTAPDSWLPGKKVTTNYQVENKGTVPAFVRIKIQDEAWKKGEETLRSTLTVNNEEEDVALKNINDDGSFVKSGDYYYYMGTIKPGEKTPVFLESYTFNPHATNSLLAATADTNVENKNSGYENSNFSFTLKAETVQATKGAVKSIWGNPKDDKVLKKLCDNFALDKDKVSKENSKGGAVNE